MASARTGEGVERMVCLAGAAESRGRRARPKTERRYLSPLERLDGGHAHHWSVQLQAAGRSEEPGIAVVEDASIASHHPVALAVGACDPSRRSGHSAASLRWSRSRRRSPKLKMPPSEAASQYPPPSGAVVMATIGALERQTPDRSGEGGVSVGEDPSVRRDQPVALRRRWSEAMPTIGLISGRDPAEPKKVASPKAKTPPSEATSQYPAPSGVGAMATIGALRCMPPVDP